MANQNLTFEEQLEATKDMVDPHLMYMKEMQKEETKKMAEAMKTLCANIGTGSIEKTTVRDEHPQDTVHSRTTVRTNMYEISNVGGPKKIYQYNVEIIGTKRGFDDKGNTRVVRAYFTSDGPNEFLTVERQKVCRRVLHYLLDEQNTALKPPLYYDFASKLYLRYELKEPLVIDINARELGESLGFTEHAQLRAAFRMVDGLRVTIQPVKLEIDNSLSVPLSEELDNINPEVVKFLDVASTMDIAKRDRDFMLYKCNQVYYHEPHLYGFTENLDLGFGIHLFAGITTSHRIIEHQKGAIIIQPKLSPFHVEETVAAKMQRLHQPRREQLENLLRGLFIYPVHLFDRREERERRRAYVVKIVGLGLPANQQTFTFHNRETDQDEQITVADYFERVHRRRLDHPEYATLKCRQGRQRVENNPGQTEPRFNFYPPEVCQIIPNQRLRTSALFGQLTSLMIRRACIRPLHLVPKMDHAARALDLGRSAALRDAGFHVESHPIKLEAPVLHPPAMVFSGGRIQEMGQDTTEWRMQHYYRPSNDPNWALYAAIRGRNAPTINLQAFKDALKREANAHNMTLGEPIDMRVLCSDQAQNNPTDTECGDLYRIMDAIAEREPHLIIVITNEDDKAIHSILKAYEQQTGIVTQNIKVATARAAMGVEEPPRRQTMSNLVHKMNMKLGGLNYTLADSKGRRTAALSRDDLIIGIYVDLVAGGLGDASANTSAPTVLGFAANDGKMPEDFTGDFYYQQSSAVVHPLTLHRAIDKIFLKFKEEHAYSPKRIIVYQSGISDGQYSNVLRYYVPVVLARMKECQIDATLVWLVASRAHSARFIPDVVPNVSKVRQQNLPAGTVIDRRVTRPNLPEFFLSSHRANQGTSVLPRYSVLYNSTSMKLAEITRLTYTLAFGHQIIGMTTGLPTPIFVAKRYAERGRMIFKAPCNSKSISDAIRDADQNPIAQWQAVTDLLGLASFETLRYRRINA